MNQDKKVLKPNLQVFTEAEIDELLDKIGECSRSGNSEEADRLMRLLPLRPGTARILKAEVGLQALIEDGCNLSEAVKEYGNEWLDS